MATNLPSCRLVSDSGGASKAQAALGKILAVISTVPPSLISTTAAPLNSKPAFHLNLTSGVESDHGSLVTDLVAAKAAAPANSVGLLNYGSISPAESIAGDARTAERNSFCECDTEEKIRNDDDDSSEEAKEEISEITNINNNNNNNIVVQSESKGSSNGIESEYAGNYLDLLLEAVDQHELLLRAVDDGEEIPTKDKSEGVNNDSSKERVGSSLKRSRVEMVRWRADPMELYEEETAPVVRSNRGRNQKLPSRYRDSVLEPWAKPPTATARTRNRGPLPIGP